MITYYYYYILRLNIVSSYSSVHVLVLYIALQLHDNNWGYCKLQGQTSICRHIPIYTNIIYAHAMAQMYDHDHDAFQWLVYSTINNFIDNPHYLKFITQMFRRKTDSNKPKT